MFKQILFLNWMGTRYGLLPFLLAAFALPYGFLAALVGGTLLTYAAKAWGVKLS